MTGLLCLAIDVNQASYQNIHMWNGKRTAKIASCTDLRAF